MNSVNPLYVPLGVVMLLVVVIATGTIMRVARARRRAGRRVIEQPNSHYTSHLVRERETRHRWHDIALDRLHEINRDEVVRLLARLDATSADALRPNERAFLDRMAEIAGSVPPLEPREKPRPIAPDLRHSTA